MLNPDKSRAIRTDIAEVVSSDFGELEVLRKDVRDLRSLVQKIQPRNATAVSLVGTDGGNNHVTYDPFSVHVIRVVDSSGNDLWLEAVTPSTSIEKINAKHFAPNGKPLSPLGRMLKYMKLESLQGLGGVFRNEEARGTSWIQEYRGALEWASLFELVRERDYGADVLIVRDGPLREKMFGKYFRELRQGLVEAIDGHLQKSRRRVYIAGVIKHSTVLQKYRLALALEGVLRTHYPCFSEVPVDMLRKTFDRWPEWIENMPGEEQFVAGKMFMVKFGSEPWDPVWIVDVFDAQVQEAGKVLGYMLNDALSGFPVPFYPRCLQRAHDAAALVGFDQDIFQLAIEDALRSALKEKGSVIDKLALQEADIAQQRY